MAKQGMKRPEHIEEKPRKEADVVPEIKGAANNNSYSNSNNSSYSNSNSNSYSNSSQSHAEN